MPISITTREAICIIDSTKRREDPCAHVELAPGRYELEEIQNPYGFDAPWFVLKGTKRGMARKAWMDEGAFEGLTEAEIDAIRNRPERSA
ncbi:hypothetical protein HYV74_01505 [Candidatus Uhrbacteria bacterium]|nr:hypothetical protein [Candidatus Uhrbacteria bacterium]